MWPPQSGIAPSTGLSPRSAAKLQRVFRKVNDRINEQQMQLASDNGSLSEFVCECSREGCSDSIYLMLDEYRFVRKSPRQFAVAVGHVDGRHEQVVRQNDRFLIVEKVGIAGDIATEESEAADAI